jgi:hypothetical protein
MSLKCLDGALKPGEAQMGRQLCFQMQETQSERNSAFFQFAHKNDTVHQKTLKASKSSPRYERMLQHATAWPTSWCNEEMLKESS